MVLLNEFINWVCLEFVGRLAVSLRIPLNQRHLA